MFNDDNQLNIESHSLMLSELLKDKALSISVSSGGISSTLIYTCSRGWLRAKIPLLFNVFEVSKLFLQKRMGSLSLYKV